MVIRVALQFDVLSRAGRIVLGDYVSSWATNREQMLEAVNFLLGERRLSRTMARRIYDDFCAWLDSFNEQSSWQRLRAQLDHITSMLALLELIEELEQVMCPFCPNRWFCERF